MIAFADLENCLAVEIEAFDVSKFTPATQVPDLDSLLNVESLTDLESLTPDPNTSVIVRNVAILAPKIATKLTKLQDLTPKDILLAEQ